MRINKLSKINLETLSRASTRDHNLKKNVENKQANAKLGDRTSLPKKKQLENFLIRDLTRNKSRGSRANLDS